MHLLNDSNRKWNTILFKRLSQKHDDTSKVSDDLGNE